MWFSAVKQLVSRNRWVIGGKLLYTTNSNSYMRFRLVPRSMTLNDIWRSFQPMLSFPRPISRSKIIYDTSIHDRKWNLHRLNKRRYVCLFICLSVADGRPNGWADQDQTWHGTHVDPGSVLVKVKVKVIWRHPANANKTPYRGPQGPREFEREAR